MRRRKAKETGKEQLQDLGAYLVNALKKIVNISLRCHGDYKNELCHSIIFVILQSIASRVDAETFSLSEIGKIAIENWCYLPGVYALGEEAEIPEIFGQRYRKMSITKRDLIKISLNFL